MGIVWEAYHKGVPLGVPGITLEIMALQNSEAPDYDCFDAKPKLSFNRPEDPPGRGTNEKHEGRFFYLRFFFWWGTRYAYQKKFKQRNPARETTFLGCMKQKKM